MGEYALHNGIEVKIGTCEDMLYLRADQAAQVTARESRHTDVMRYADAVRFRFPFPDEDGMAPGSFEDGDRSLALYGVEPPAVIDHGSIQFTSNYPSKGLLVSLPCPESEKGKASAEAGGYKVHRNGYAGPVKIVQQRKLGDLLVLVAECGSCGAKYRLPTFADAEPYVVALRSYADRAYRDDDRTRTEFYSAVAERITDGYLAGAWERTTRKAAIQAAAGAL